MSPLDWNDAYHDLWMQAAQSRGTITSVGEPPDAARYSTLPEWPRTTGADVIAIASFVDPILTAMPLRPGGYGVTRLWRAAIIDLEDNVFASPSAEYAHNRTFWSTLLTVAAYLGSIGAPVPADDAWEALADTLWSPVIVEHSHDAVSPPAVEPSSGTSRNVTAPTFEALWDQLRAEFAQLRGSIRLETLPGETLDVPRTTNTDAIALERYWSRALVQLQIKVMTGGVPMPADFETVQLRWSAAARDVTHLATSRHPGATYPDNGELWSALRALAKVLEALGEAPAPYEINDRHLAPPIAPSTPPTRPIESRPAARDLSTLLADASSHAVGAVDRFIDHASDRLVSTIGRPLLVAGATVGALLLILYGTAGCDCDCQNAEEPAPIGEAG